MGKYIVTGASGFIGNALTKKLLANGDEVWAIVRSKDKMHNLDSANLHIVEADFTQYSQLSDMIAEKDFDCFFHFAWQGYGKSTNDFYTQIPNIIYACESAVAADKLRCKKFVFADSSHEFLKRKDNQGQTSFCSIYGAAKYAARRMCIAILQNSDTQFMGVLFTNIFGVGDFSNRSTNTMLKKLLAGEDLDLTPQDVLYDWTYIDDCIDGVLSAVKSGKNNTVYYVGHKDLQTFGDIMSSVRDIVEPLAELRFGKYPDNSFVDYSLIDLESLRQDTGFECKADFRESIMKTVEWLKEQNSDKKIGGGGQVKYLILLAYIAFLNKKFLGSRRRYK